MAHPALTKAFLQAAATATMHCQPERFTRYNFGWACAAMNFKYWPQYAAVVNLLWLLATWSRKPGPTTPSTNCWVWLARLDGHHNTMEFSVSLLVWRLGRLGTRGPDDPRTWRPEDWGPKDQDLALSFYDRNATCVNVLSSNVRLYRCGPQSPHCYTHSRHSSHQIVPFHTISALSILYSANPKIVSLIACKTTSVTSCSHWGPRVKGQMQIVSRLTRFVCVQAWLCRTDSRQLWESKKSENSVVCYK